MFFSFSKKIFWVATATLIIFSFVFFVVDAAEIKFPENINPSIPGTNEATQAEPNPIGIIGNLFQFALLIGGLLAFVMVVYGGIEYAASGDSGSGQKEAKDRIQQALLGLLLLAGSFVLLQTINPRLTKLTFPTLDSVMGTVDLPNTSGSQGTAGGECNIGSACSGELLCSPENVCYSPLPCPSGSNGECSGAGFTGYTCIDFKCQKPLISCTNGQQQCAIDQTCVSGVCKNNGTAGAFCNNGSCGDGPACSASGVCNPQGYCVRNQDCESQLNKECVGGRCVDAPSTSAVACTDPGDCPNGLGCVFGACNNCSSRETCSQGMACASNGRCLPPLPTQQCQRDENCPNGYKCDTRYGECRISCSQTGENMCPSYCDGYGFCR